MTLTRSMHVVGMSTRGLLAAICCLAVAALGAGAAYGQGMGGGGMGGGGMGGGGMGGGGMGGGQKVMLGGMIFNDSGLSQPGGQSCASCHSSTAGYADPGHSLPVSKGAVTGRFGGRNAPTAAYASFSPTFCYDANRGQYVGGQFWDGRAATLADQAKGPFLNPLEMNMPNKAAVVSAVRNAMYGNMMTTVYGSTVFNNVDTAYNAIADALAAFESSSTVNQFTSKYDKYLAGQATLTAAESRGMAKFQGNCTSCHARPSGSTKQVFTDFTYHNLGLPRNPGNPYYSLPPDLNPDGAAHVDLGLGGALGMASEDGKFKTPTLRNVEVTGDWGHNGYFTSLADVVDFIANCNLEPNRWPAPEVGYNLDGSIGSMNFSAQDISDVVAFLDTLTDSGMVPEPATMALLIAGAAVALLRRRRRA